MSKFRHNFSYMYRYKWSFVSIQMLWPTLKIGKIDLCIDTNTGVYRYKYQNLEILTDMYLSMQACFESSWVFWILRTNRCVSIHASMLRYTGAVLSLRDLFCIDTDHVCIDTKCSKSNRRDFRTFVSIHQCLYRYKIPKSQFFKVLENSSLLSSHL